MKPETLNELYTIAMRLQNLATEAAIEYEHEQGEHRNRIRNSREATGRDADQDEE